METKEVRPTKVVVDCATGKVETIELTDQEMLEAETARLEQLEQLKAQKELTTDEQKREEALWNS